MARSLTTLPLIEYMFDVRWSPTSVTEGLYDEYELSLGRFYSIIRKRFPIRHRLLSVPREVFVTMPASGIVFDRFLSSAPSSARLAYPLKQYGPGIASYNVDKEAYNWSTLQAELPKFYEELLQSHDELERRVSLVILRSIDFFETAQPAVFLRNKLGVRIENPILTKIPVLAAGHEIPQLITTWKLAEHFTEVNVAIRPAAVAERDGLVLDIAVQSTSAALNTRGIKDLLSFQHKIAGDAFFGLLTTDLRNELGYRET